jgi:hypothetical protein
MKVSTEIDNNFGYEKITQLVDNIPLIQQCFAARDLSGCVTVCFVAVLLGNNHYFNIIFSGYVANFFLSYVMFRLCYIYYIVLSHI